jgi:hypothetical protein
MALGSQKAGVELLMSSPSRVGDRPGAGDVRVLYDLEVRIVIRWHILSRSDFAVFGLGVIPCTVLLKIVHHFGINHSF